MNTGLLSILLPVIPEPHAQIGNLIVFHSTFPIFSVFCQVYQGSSAFLAIYLTIIRRPIGPIVAVGLWDNFADFIFPVSGHGLVFEGFLDFFLVAFESGPSAFVLSLHLSREL